MILQKYKEWFEQYSNAVPVDQTAQLLTQEAYEKIDCLECGQCCRTTVTTFNEEDITKTAKWLNISRKEFIKKYLIQDLDKTYTTITVPCPFLNLSTNQCNIYEVRPSSCASFPHTDKPFFLRRKKAHLQNSRFCPITQYVLEGLMSLP